VSNFNRSQAAAGRTLLPLYGEGSQTGTASASSIDLVEGLIPLYDGGALRSDFNIAIQRVHDSPAWRNWAREAADPSLTSPAALAQDDPLQRQPVITLAQQ